MSDLEFFSGKCYGFKFQGNGFSSFSFRGMVFLTIIKLDVGEEHEDEDDTGCWGRTRFGIVRVLFPGEGEIWGFSMKE